MNPVDGILAAARDPVDVDLGSHQVGIAVPVEVVEHDLAGSGQPFKFKVMVMVAEADSLFEEFGAHRLEDADQLIETLDAVAVFRRGRAERREVAFKRLESVDERGRVPLERIDSLVGRTAEEVVPVELPLDHVCRERRAGNLNGLIADFADLVEGLVQIAFSFAVVAQIVEGNRDLSVGSFHFPVFLWLSLIQRTSRIGVFLT